MKENESSIGHLAFIS